MLEKIMNFRNLRNLSRVWDCGKVFGRGFFCNPFLLFMVWAESGHATTTFSTGAIIATSADYAVLVYAADVDGDGDIDVRNRLRNLICFQSVS